MSKSQYQIAFNEHSVHATFRQVKRQRAELPEDLLKAAQEHDPEGALARLKPALDYIGALLGSADPALITQQMLSGLDNSLQQISSALTPLKENEDFAQVQTIQSSTEALLNAAIQVAPAVGVWAKEDASKAASLLGEAATAKTRDLQGQASDLQGQLDQLRNERLAELQAQVETVKTQTDAELAAAKQAVEGFQTQFTADQEIRATEFENTKKELSDELAEVIRGLKSTAEDAATRDRERAETEISNLKENAETTLDFLNEKKDQVRKLVDLVTKGTTAGAFGEEAQDQKEQADHWRRVAIGFGLVAALAGILGVGASFVWDTSVYGLIAKVAAVTLFLGIAGYAAGQSNQHRRREQRAKRLELELVAFGPFAEPLGDDARLARKDFIERLFVGDPGEDRADGDPRLSDETLSALVKLIDFVRLPQAGNQSS